MSLGLILRAPAAAEQRELKTNKSEKVDAVLLLDGSGSMLLTDPKKLREEGAKLFVQFLKEGDRLGIVEFAGSARVVRELAAYEKSGEAAVRADLEKVASSGQYTDILAGVEAAKAMFERNPRREARKVVILLSDGKMEPDPIRGTSEQRTSALMSGVLPGMKSDEFKVYTLSFSDLADRELLSEIAAATDALSMFTPEAEKIHELFADLFLAVKKPQMVPMTSKGFSIDDEIKEATFYVNRETVQDFTLQDPDLNTITPQTASSGMKWFRGQKFDVITIAKPKEGDWRLVGISPQDGFATVLTDLKLVTDWPTSLNSGYAALLQARLYDADKPIELPEMSDVIKFGFQVIPTDKVSEPVIRELLSDNGEDGDKIAHDGIFSAEVSVKEPGEYKLVVLAKGPTFSRSQQLPFHVKPRLVSLRVGEKEESSAHEHGRAESHGHEQGHGHGEEAANDSSSDVFLIELSQEAAAMKKIEMKLTAVAESRRRFSLPVEKSTRGANLYEASPLSLPEDGLYQVQASVSGLSANKKKVQASSEVLKYNRVTATKETTGEATEDVQLSKPAAAAVESLPPVPTTPSIMPYVGLVTILNLAVAGLIALMMLKSQVSGGFQVPAFASVSEIEAKIPSLRELLSRSDIDIESLFAQDSAQSSGAPESSAPAEAAPAEAEAQPQSEPAAEAPPADAGTPPEGGQE